MSVSIGSLLQQLFITPYSPDAAEQGYLQRAETQAASQIEVTVAVPDAKEASRLFGVPLSRHGLQPVFIRVVNRSAFPYRLQFRSIAPRYYTPLEAAARCHFSLLKRLSAFGILIWFFLPLLWLMPFKLLTARWSNLRMDLWFQDRGFHRRPIAAHSSSEGFVFTPFDVGTKMVRVRLMPSGISDVHSVSDVVKGEATSSPFHNEPEPTQSSAQAVAAAEVVEEQALTATLSAILPDISAHLAAPAAPEIDLTFAVQVPGINVDYLHRKLDALVPVDPDNDCTALQLVERLRSYSVVTTNERGSGAGDPVNLVVIGEFETLLNAFAGRWDETETITLATCWKTARAFLTSSEYRYSPVSSLYLFGRSQDIALQQIRDSISERIHLRLWLAPLTLHKDPVWVGQVSRDIGVRFTTAAWNLTTHRIDPDIDESRDYVLEDLLDAERVAAAGYVDATPASTPQNPRRNLTGDPYFSDGKRVIILLSPTRTAPRFIAWS